MLHANGAAPENSLALYQPFLCLLAPKNEPGEKATEIEEFLSKSRSIASYQSKLEQLNGIISDIRQLPSTTKHGFFAIDSRSFNDLLIKKVRALIDQVIDSICEANRRANRAACEEFDSIANKLMDKPETTEDMASLEE